MTKYPLIDRTDVEFYPDEQNIGYNEGFLSDGRPYRLECWAIDQITNITIFTSVVGIEDFSSEEVCNFLQKEGLFKILPGGFSGQALKFTDKNGNEFWSANIVIGDDEGMYATSDIPLKPFKDFKIISIDERKKEARDTIYSRIKEEDDFKDYSFFFIDNDGSKKVLEFCGRVLGHREWTDKSGGSDSLIALQKNGRYLYFFVDNKTEKGFVRFYDTFEEVDDDPDIDVMLKAKAEDTIEWYPLC